MARFRSGAIAAAMLAASSPAIAMAQTAATTASAAQTAFERRAAQLVDLFAGNIAYADYFDPHFQTAVPEPQFKSFSAGLIAHFGKPVAIDRATRTHGRSGTVLLRFERGVATVLLDVGAATDARVTGLRVTGVTVANDSFDKVAAEIAALPGQTGFLVAELDGTTVRPLASATPTGNSPSARRSSSISSTNLPRRSPRASGAGPTSCRCRTSAFRRRQPPTGPSARR